MENTVVYGNWQTDENTPLTVRIEWLPSGAIIPRYYWTPDGTRYEVENLYETVQCCHLKDKGIGIRFRVGSKIIETPESFSDILDSQHETYIYFADNSFCEKNMIDERYLRTGKEYIPVTLDIFPNGDYEIIHFWVHGQRYIVEKTLTRDIKGAFHTGGLGVWHKVETRLVNENDDDPDPQMCVRRVASLYWEFNKWFTSVEVKTA